MSCRGCDIQEIVNRMDVQELIKEQLSLETTLVSEEIFRKRMASCQVCSFGYQETCTKCGCYYEFRAHLPSKNCPMGYWN